MSESFKVELTGYELGCILGALSFILETTPQAAEDFNIKPLFDRLNQIHEFENLCKLAKEARTNE